MASTSRPKPEAPGKSRGSELLKAWRGHFKKADVVQALDIDYSAISAFETGTRRPGKKRAERIAENTQGAVPAESWTQPPKKKERAS